MGSNGLYGTVTLAVFLGLDLIPAVFLPFDAVAKKRFSIEKRNTKLCDMEFEFVFTGKKGGEKGNNQSINRIQFPPPIQKSFII